MKLLVSELRPAILATLVLAVVLCGIYPALITGVSQAAFHSQANGSLFKDKAGRTRGSLLLAQNFTARQYFHPRPSAAGTGHDAASSGGSNLGPTSQKLHDQIKERIAIYRAANGLAKDTTVPADAVTASGSGLDPHISLRNAHLQAARVATARQLPLETVNRLISANTDGPSLGFLGHVGVNVVKLNLALDQHQAP